MIIPLSDFINKFILKRLSLVRGLTSANGFSDSFFNSSKKTYSVLKAAAYLQNTGSGTFLHVFNQWLMINAVIAFNNAFISPEYAKIKRKAYIGTTYVA